MVDRFRRQRLARLAIIFALLTYYVYAVAAHAQPAGPGPRAEMAKRFCADEEAIFRARMAFIEAKLDLKPEQRQGFLAFADQARRASQPLRDLCTEGASPKVQSAADGLRSMQRRAAAMATTLGALATAVETFGAALSTDQQEKLAEAVTSPLNPFGPPPGAFHSQHSLP